MHQKHWLVVTDQQGHREVCLDAPNYSIGRDPTCDIQLFTQFVSRHHATLIQLQNDNEGFEYRIVDGEPMGKPSTNGILVNSQKVNAHTLRHEDEIVFGPQCRATYYIQKDPSGGNAFDPLDYPRNPNSWTSSAEVKA